MRVVVAPWVPDIEKTYAAFAEDVERWPLFIFSDMALWYQPLKVPPVPRTCHVPRSPAGRSITRVLRDRNWSIKTKPRPGAGR